MIAGVQALQVAAPQIIGQPAPHPDRDRATSALTYRNAGCEEWEKEIDERVEALYGR